MIESLTETTTFQILLFLKPSEIPFIIFYYKTLNKGKRENGKPYFTNSRIFSLISLRYFSVLIGKDQIFYPNKSFCVSERSV